MCCLVRVRTIIFKTCFLKEKEFSIEWNLAVKPTDSRVSSQWIVCIVVGPVCGMGGDVVLCAMCKRFYFIIKTLLYLMEFNPNFTYGTGYKNRELCLSKKVEYYIQPSSQI
jgi:hypothetical protein